VVILPYWEGRHPDHYTASKLGYEACFLAGLAKLDIERALAQPGSGFGQVASAVASLAAGENQAESGARSPHRPYKIIYATLYHDVRPSFVVDITEQFEARFESLMAYKSQFSDQKAGSDIFPARAEIRARIESMARFYGAFAGVTYAEPFLQRELGLVEDVLAIPVKSI
jgi:LmbE family N-acetylglucosaminyl deacetylase